MTSVRSRLAASLAAGAVLFGSFAALGASPASAAEGDASASGASINVGVTPAGEASVNLSGLLGDTGAPPSAAVAVGDVSIDALPVAALNVAAITAEATSDTNESSANTEVVGAVLTVPLIDAEIGGPILEVGGDVIKTTVTCPTGGTPTALFGPTAALRVAGQDVTLDADGSATIGVFAGDDPVGTVAIRTDVSTIGANTASAVAVLADIDINMELIGQVSGQVRIASADCTASAAAPVPTATSLDPDQGSVTGGTQVIVVGSGFVPGSTTVTIDDITIPAGEVTVDSAGMTAMFTTPPHAVGPVDVVVNTADGTTDPLDFTYIDDESAAPYANTIDPDQGPAAGGTEVTLTGGRFVPGGTTITIGGITIPADEVIVDSDGVTATFTTPPHVAGPVEVAATTNEGTTDPLTFTYIDDGGPTEPTVPTEPTGPTEPTVPTQPTDPTDPGSPGGPGGGGPGNGGVGNSGSGGSGSGAVLPRTGSNTAPLALAGIFAILAGGSILAVRRRMV